MDSLTIAGAALELQIYVLTRLGKRPSIRTWQMLFQRTAASLLISTYLNREDAWTVDLILRRISWGMEGVADTASRAAGSLQEVDWSEQVDRLIPNDAGLATVLKAALMGGLQVMGLTAGIGATGLKEISRILGDYGEQILEGILAAAVVYFHGMALAAECLSVDKQHRQSPEMSRSIQQAMRGVSGAVGQALAEQLGGLKDLFRQKVEQQAATLRRAPAEAARNLWEKARGMP